LASEIQRGGKADTVNGDERVAVTTFRMVSLRSFLTGYVRKIGMPIARRFAEVSMSLVRLLGFTTMGCGCVSGRYRDVGTNREVTYIEEKGTSCANSSHQRNQPVSADRVAHGFGAPGLRAS
jgi:hypothetical protein